MVNKCVISILMVVGQEYISWFKTSTCVQRKISPAELPISADLRNAEV
jgi:hypothetical protein